MPSVLYDGVVFLGTEAEEYELSQSGRAVEFWNDQF